MTKTRKLPFCFSDYRPRDRACNGSRHQLPCALRNQCSAFGILLQETGSRRENYLAVFPTHTRENRPGLFDMLNREVARLRITDGLRVLRRARARARPKEHSKPLTAMEVCAWFVHRLGVESRRNVLSREGLTEIGDLFTAERRDGCTVRCRVGAVECLDVCTVKLRRRRCMIEVECSIEISDGLTRRERDSLYFQEEDDRARFLYLDQVASSTLATRIMNTLELPRIER